MEILFLLIPLIVLGKIPVVGKVFSGKEGGGLFAATYGVKGTYDNPEISFNPLSVLAPGFLRDVFTFSK